MTEIDPQTYPQKAGSQQPGAPTAAAPAVRGPNFFKQGENIPFERAANVLSLAAHGPRLRLKCAARVYLNATTWTHETSMHQFRPDPEAGERQLEIEITFWSEAVFRVRFASGRLPEEEPEGAFPPPEARMLVGQPDPAVQVALEETPFGWAARTGQIELQIERGPLRLSARGQHGRLFWQQKRSDLFTADIFDISVARAAGRTGCFESFALDGQEEIFGLGERFDSVTRTGRTVDFWNKDAIGTSSRRTYINVPFLFSTRGYGLFLNSSARTEWEIGTLEAFTAGFAVEDEQMDYFIIYGPRPADILFRYAALTGFSPAPPVWSFGLWMSRNSYISWDVVNEVAHELRRRGIPADVLHLDTAWFKEDWNCDLRFSEERFADPAGHMRRLKEQGFRVSLWQYNFVPPRANNRNYQEGAARGYFAKGPDGEVFRYPPEVKGSWVDDAVIDFSNPEAADWYTAQIAGLIQMGASTIKTDFGEGIPEDAHYYAADGRRFHNLYSLVYNSAVARAIHSQTGEWIVWARSGTAGSQRYPVHWGGDSQCSFGGLAGTLRAALSLGLSGFPFFSHDIGGFIGRPDPELYVRWAQFGLFSSHSRCHGAGDYNPREPWTFGEEACGIFLRYDRLRYRLLPYIYNQARRCSASAKPMVRALLVDYPDDRNTWPIQDQYLFGDSLLIAPVLRPLAEAQTRCLYLPAGVWIDYWTHQAVCSRGEWIERPVDLATMPIYVRAGSILPYGEERLSTENRIGPIVLLEVYAGASGRLDYADGEKTFTAVWQDGRLALEGLSPEPQITVIGG